MQISAPLRIPLNVLTLREVLENSKRRFSMRPSLSFLDEEPLLYEDFYNSVAAVSSLLTEHGIGFGDPVAILSENSPHWAVAYFAITSMGAVAVPILPEFHTQAIRHILTHSEAKAAFVSDKLLTKLGDTDFPNLQLISIESFTDIQPGLTRDLLREFREAGLREFRKLRTKAKKAVNRIPNEPREDDVAAIIYTSGTSGFSKGVVLTHRNIVYDALLVQDIFPLTHEDRFLSLLPLAHAYECTLGLILPVLHGAQVFYLGKTPTPRVLLPAMEKIRPTTMATVPLIIEKIYKSSIKPKFTANRLMRRLYAIPFTRAFLHKMAGKKLQAAFGGKMRAFAIGGAPLAPDVNLFLHEAGFPYATGYGMTENSPLITGAGPNETRLYSCGRVLPGLRIRISEPDPQNGVGEILVKGPTVMREYFKAPEMTEEVLDEDGWLHTGDLGSMDKDGFLYIKGRCKNMLLGPSGENIYPEEIEAQLLQNIHVLECVVYMQNHRIAAKVHLDLSRMDQEFGNLPETKAMEARGNLLENIRQETNLCLADFAKIHKISEQIDPFEKTPTQKIKRYLYVD